MKQEEINKAVDQVIESQKINGLSPEGFKMLSDLKMAFEVSINSIEQILFGDDVKDQLEYLVRDWNLNKDDRNIAIVKIMERLQTDLANFKEENIDE